MITVIIPVFNEEELLERSARKVHEYMNTRGIAHYILVVSNGSTDRTSQIGNSLSATEAEWFGFIELPERGVGLAFVNGVKHAKGDYIISLDIDLPADLNFIDYANELLKYCDMVVGSKSMGNQHRALIRVLGSQLYILIAQILFRLTISDYAPSTKAYRRSAIEEFLPNLDHWTAYVFELCVILRIRKKRVIQIGVDCEDHRKSRFNLLHEGFYRYRHLFQCLRKLHDKNSWFYR